MKPAHPTLEDLQLLFEFVPPDKLRSSITAILLQYLMLSPKENPPPKELIEDVYFLIEFLEKQKNLDFWSHRYIITDL